MFHRKTFGAVMTAALQILPIAIKRADHTILFDNSTEEGYRLVAILSPTESQWLNAPPHWSSALTR